MYDSSTRGFQFMTLREKNEYFKNNVVKFSDSHENKIVVADCKYSIDSEWDILVLWFGPKKEKSRALAEIKKTFKSIVPLYAVFTKHYVLVTKILIKQTFQSLQSRCSILEIADMFLYEMGAILVKDGIVPPRKYIGTTTPIVWEIERHLEFVLPKMHGWFSNYTRTCLEYILANYDYKVVVELGSWLGKSTSHILQNMKSGSSLYCFDKFQNVAVSEYEFKNPARLDKFYFSTPRYETFCKNILPYIKKGVKCYTVKYDVNNFIQILKSQRVRADIIFIDAIKNTKQILRIYDKIFSHNKNAIIVGDDHVFKSVQDAVRIFTSKDKKVNYLITDMCYILTYRTIDNVRMNKYIKANYFPPEESPEYIYEVLYGLISEGKSRDVIELIEENKRSNDDSVDVNQPLQEHNDITLYTHAIIQKYVEGDRGIEQVLEYMEQNYEIKKVDSLLGLNYTDYKNGEKFY